MGMDMTKKKKAQQHNLCSGFQEVPRYHPDLTCMKFGGGMCHLKMYKKVSRETGSKGNASIGTLMILYYHKVIVSSIQSDTSAILIKHILYINIYLK